MERELSEIIDEFVMLAADQEPHEEKIFCRIFNRFGGSRAEICNYFRRQVLADENLRGDYVNAIIGYVNNVEEFNRKTGHTYQELNLHLSYSEKLKKTDSELLNIFSTAACFIKIN